MTSQIFKTFLSQLKYKFCSLVPPKIERKHLKDITVSAGEMLKFEGNIIGEPPADVTWKKETEVIETTRDKSLVITNVPYNTKLIIRSCQRPDQVLGEDIRANPINSLTE